MQCPSTTAAEPWQIEIIQAVISDMRRTKAFQIEAMGEITTGKRIAGWAADLARALPQPPTTGEAK